MALSLPLPQHLQKMSHWDTSLPSWQSFERNENILLHSCSAQQYTYSIGYDRRKFRSQTSDNMDRWKAEQGRGREKRKIRREKSRRDRVRRKKMQMREKVGKSRNTVCFPMICGSGGSKSRLAKAAGAEPAGQMRDEKLHAVVARNTCRSQNVQNTSASDHFWKLRCRKSARRCGAKHISKSKCTKHLSVGPLLEVEMSKKCTPLWREAHFEVKMYKTPQPRTTFGSWDVEKVHAVVARSTFRSQNVQSTPGSDHFWKLRCRKSARRCGAKHISKSKCTIHLSLGPLLEVEMSKKCTPLWREAHFQVKMYKIPQPRTTFGSWDVEKVHAVVARSTFRSENVQNTTCSRHFWRFRCRFAWQAQGIVHLVKKWAKREGFAAFPETMAGVGHLKRIFKDAFSVAGAVQETCSSELLGGPGADFLRGVAFWSIRSSGLLRWFCVTGAALRMTWHQFFVARAVLYTGGVEKSQNASVRGSQRCTQLSIFEGSLAELLCFWRC